MMTQHQHPVPYEKVELWLKSYKDWKARLKYVQSELSYIPELTRTLQMVAAHSGQELVPIAGMDKNIVRLPIR
ncbi:hypothetical protein [Paenibacillus sp. QZ-Y1]|uniref:hypothetical protein n=1 Tax=Paenibacillus sp. QZ-Y1 TaxID=3414511 RepID=UPI003F78F122